MTGHIELPAGSGLWFATDGTLATHPQGELLRVRVKDVTGRALVDDMPIVIDHFAPRGMAYVLEDMVIVNRAGEKIEQVWTMDFEAARRIREQAGRQQPERNRPRAGPAAAGAGAFGKLMDDRAMKAISPLDRKINRAIADEIYARLPADAGQKIMAAVAQDAARVQVADRAVESEHTTERRRVAVTDLPNGDHISTVLLHSHLADGGDPDAYETLVTRGPHEGMCERHATRREAERAHRVMVDMLSADE